MYKSLRMDAIILAINPGGTPSGNKIVWQMVVFQLSKVLYVQISDVLGSPGPSRLGRKNDFGVNVASGLLSNTGAWYCVPSLTRLRLYSHPPKQRQMPMSIGTNTPNRTSNFSRKSYGDTLLSFEYCNALSMAFLVNFLLSL